MHLAPLVYANFARCSLCKRRVEKLLILLSFMDVTGLARRDLKRIENNKTRNNKFISLQQDKTK